MVGMLHGNGLWKLSQNSLLEILEAFVIETTTDKLLILQRTDKEVTRSLADGAVGRPPRAYLPRRRVTVTFTLRKKGNFLP